MAGLTQKRYWVGALFIAILGLALKLTLLALDAFPFNADEAVVGLMARHILQGRWPAFFYGQAYMGSLDATLVAAGFALLGESVVVIRLVQAVLYAATIVSAAAVAWFLFNSKPAAWITAALLAFPSVNVMLYTTVSLGGYGEALLIGNLLILLALKVWRQGRGYALWGLLAGLGFWAFGLTLIYTIPTGIVIGIRLWRSKTKLAAAAAAFAIGAFPWIWEAASRGVAPFIGELVGGAISGASAGPGQHLINLLLFGPTVISGIRPPWTAELIAPVLAPLSLGFWLAVLIFGLTRLRANDEARVGRWMMFGVMAVFLAGFLLTPFGADPSGRYFVPLAVPLAVLAVEMFIEVLVPRFGRATYVLLGLVLMVNLWGSVKAARNNPPGISTQFDPVAQIDHSYLPELLAFLEAEGELTGYTNYWVSYPLAFASQERIVYTPALPYHQDFRYADRDDRYAPYGEIVGSSAQTAYITTNFPALNQRLRDGLTSRGIVFQETSIGPYTVFHGLGQPIHPRLLGVP